MTNNFTEMTTLDVLFEEAYSRCEALDSYKKECITDHLNHLLDMRMACEAGGDDYCGKYPDKAMAVLRENLLSVHSTITNHIVSDMNLGINIPKPDLSYLERVSPDKYCKEVGDSHLYDEIESGLDLIANQYDSDPVIVSRMLRHLEILFIKEGKRLDGSDQYHYSAQDNYGYNYISLQLEAVLAAANNLINFS